MTPENYTRQMKSKNYIYFYSKAILYNLKKYDLNIKTEEKNQFQFGYSKINCIEHKDFFNLMGKQKHKNNIDTHLKENLSSTEEFYVRLQFIQ